MMKNWVLVLCLLPGLASASVGDDLNSLIQRFFGGGQAPVVEERVAPEVAKPLPMVDLSGFDQEAVQRQIMEEEAALELFDQKIADQQSSLRQARDQAQTAIQQLSLLDQQLGLNQEKYDQYSQQQAEWQSRLETLTREKSSLKAQIRIARREYEKSMIKNFVQKENFTTQQSFSAFDWLLLEKSVSQILLERGQQARFLQKKSRALAQLKALENQLNSQEKAAAQLSGRLQFLARQLAAEYQVLENLAELKARANQQAERQQQDIVYQLERVTEQQQQSQLSLEVLRQALRDKRLASDDESQIEDAGQTSLLAWPVSGKLEIAAGFADLAYEAAFDRPHLGLDLVLDQGSEVLAAGAGVVEEVVFDGNNYAYVSVRHSEDLLTVYGHVSLVLVEVGQEVEPLQLIAQSGGEPGTPGAGFFTSGSHLHFEVHFLGEPQDPLKYLPGL